jgi:Thioredoxin-like
MKIRFHLPLLALAINILTTSLLLVSQAGCEPNGGQKNPIEVGKVRWGRDYEAAITVAKSTGKPVFLLFQEIPGCAGCKQFGRDVLGDDKVVRAIEKNFTPLLIPNNSSGKDAEILSRLGEPAWNYQVVRFLDAAGRDLIPRKDHVWEAPELLERMSLALQKAGRPKMLVDATKRVAIAQYCFWEGEMKIGAIEGVKRTEAGFLDGNEVTLVDYDPAEISLDDLTKKAKAAGVASQIFTNQQGYKKAPASDQKRQLQGTKYANQALTPEQATKVNAFVRTAPDKAAAFLDR